jgi:4'-phosphopantetheinyl transferase
MSTALEIYACKIDKRVTDSEFYPLLEFVDPFKKESIRRFRRWQDAHLSLFADLLVRVIIGQKEKINNKEVIFLTGPYGKPVLSGRPHIQFNVSHSGDWVVCAIDSSEVGIDIEQIADVDLSISEQFFSGDEHEDILKSASPLERFFDFWTIKESYLKFIGMGLSEPLNSFSVCFLPDGRIQIRKSGIPLPDLHFKQYRGCEGYKLAVCCKHHEFPDECILTTPAEIVRSIKGIKR